MNLNKKGLSLLEMVIASFLLFLIVFAMYEILKQGMLMWRHSSKQQSNEQKAIVISNKLFSELKITAASSITTFTYMDDNPVNNLNYYISTGNIENDPSANNGISFRSPVSSSTGEINLDDWMGKLRWQSYFIYYLEKDPKQIGRFVLYQREISLGDRIGEVNSTPLETFRPGKTIDYYITASSDADIKTPRLICSDVVKLCFSHYPLNRVEFYVEIGQSVTSGKETASNRASKIKVLVAN